MWQYVSTFVYDGDFSTLTPLQRHLLRQGGELVMLSVRSTLSRLRWLHRLELSSAQTRHYKRQQQEASNKLALEGSSSSRLKSMRSVGTCCWKLLIVLDCLTLYLEGATSPYWYAMIVLHDK